MTGLSPDSKQCQDGANHDQQRAEHRERPSALQPSQFRGVIGASVSAVDHIRSTAPASEHVQENNGGADK